MKFTKYIVTYILNSQDRSLFAGLKYYDVGSHLLVAGETRTDVISRLET